MNNSQQNNSQMNINSYDQAKDNLERIDEAQVDRAEAANRANNEMIQINDNYIANLNPTSAGNLERVMNTAFNKEYDLKDARNALGYDREGRRDRIGIDREVLETRFSATDDVHCFFEAGNRMDQQDRDEYREAEARRDSEMRAYLNDYHNHLAAMDRMCDFQDSNNDGNSEGGNNDGSSEDGDNASESSSNYFTASENGGNTNDGPNTTSHNNNNDSNNSYNNTNPDGNNNSKNKDDDSNSEDSNNNPKGGSNNDASKGESAGSGSLLDDFADPSLEQPSYMDPED